MINRAFFLVCFIGMTSFGNGPAFGRVISTEEEALKKVFPYAENIEKRELSFDEQHTVALEKSLKRRFRSKSMTYFVGFLGEKLGGEESRVSGYAFIDHVIGKKEPITYMVALEPDGAVRALEILVYRESQGSEIINARFRNQFVGKDAKDPLRLKKDIDNMSGATLSCRAISRGVKKILVVFKQMILRNES